jgi:predicted aminopeptidase
MIKQTIRILWQLTFFLIMLCCLLFHDIVIYGIEQGKGQLSIVMNAQPIENILQDKETSDSVKQKLLLIKAIKNFAIDSLGIKPNKNYSTFYNQTNQKKLITISACEPYSFRPKEWSFPFLGTVSYKGFFNQQKAQKEILELKLKGYDVDSYTPSGWSTLGWFTDPVLYGMLKRNEGQLANLIIHELTHGTLYVKNNVTFNENLANFIGDKGAEKFLITNYGVTSDKYKKYEQGKVDNKLYNEYILKSKAQLDSLYKTFGSNDSEETKKEKKKEMLLKIVLGVNQLPIKNKKEYFNYSLQIFSEGNAFFMAFDRYDSQYDEFEKEYTTIYQSNLKAYLTALKEKYTSL